jgi:hypothetical protein
VSSGDGCARLSARQWNCNQIVGSAMCTHTKGPVSASEWQFDIPCVPVRNLWAEGYTSTVQELPSMGHRELHRGYSPLSWQHPPTLYCPHLFEQPRHRPRREICLERSPDIIEIKAKSAIGFAFKHQCPRTYIRASNVGSDHFRPKKLSPKGMPLSKTPKGTVVTGYL